MSQSTSKNNVKETSVSNDSFRLAGIVVSLSTIALLTKVFGFAEKFVIGYFFGTSDTADVYFASTAIILSIIWFVKELMYPTLLPVFADSMSQSKTASGNLFRKAFLSAAGFLVAASLLLLLSPGLLTRILLPGFSESKRIFTSGMLRTLAPAAFFLGLATVTFTTLNAHRRFLKAAIPEALNKLFIVLGLVLLIPVLGIHSLALVMGLGGLACLLAQLYFIPERSFLWKNKKNEGDNDYFKKVLLLMGPVAFGVVFSHISGHVDNLLASTLPSGRLSYLGYSKKLIDAILLIGPVALVTVVYAQLSHLASANEYEKFRTLISKSFRLIIYLSVPVACLLTGLREPIIRFLFQRGQFTADSTFGTSQAFMIYAIGLTTFSLETLFVYSFFAVKDTKTPVLYGVLCVLLDILLAIVLLRPLGYLGIAGAFVISKTIKILALGTVLSKRHTGIFDLQIIPFSIKLAATTCMVWISLKILLNINNSDSSLDTLIFDLILPGGGALLAFIGCSYFLRIEEFKAMLSLLKYRKAAIKSLYEQAK